MHSSQLCIDFFHGILLKSAQKNRFICIFGIGHAQQRKSSLKFSYTFFLLGYLLKAYDKLLFIF